MGFFKRYKQRLSNTNVSWSETYSDIDFKDPIERGKKYREL